MEGNEAELNQLTTEGDEGFAIHAILSEGRCRESYRPMRGLAPVSMAACYSPGNIPRKPYVSYWRPTGA